MGDIKGRTERRELTPCIIYADMSCHHSPHHKKGGREGERGGNLGFESVETGKKGWTEASEGLELARSFIGGT